MLAENSPSAAIPDYVQQNEIVLLESLRFLAVVNEELSNFSKVLYEQEYSLDVYRSFRKLYEAISNVSNSIYAFDSDEAAFNIEKDELINRSLEICETFSLNQPAETKKSRKNGGQRDE